MIKAKRIEAGAGIADVRLGEIYHGRILPNKLVGLNRELRAKLTNPDMLDKDEGFVAIKITKINLPYSIEAEYTPGEYEIDETNREISSLGMDEVGKTFSIKAKVIGIRQTGGPTLFTLSDGNGTISAKAFIGPGKRAFPEIEEGALVSATIRLNEYDGMLESELKSFRLLSDSQALQMEERFESIVAGKAKADDVKFMIESPVLNRLKNKMVEFATAVKKAIIESRPIVLRHHADCDGYCAAIALERAIVPLIIEMHNDPKAARRLYKRAPSKAPFYEYADVIKDLTVALDDAEKFGAKEPLIILADNGSTEEDIPAIKKMKLYNAQVIVIDHHYPGETDEYCRLPVDYHIDAHVNPYGVGGDSTLTAGMLASETARMIRKDTEKISHLPALAGIADHSRCDEMDSYLILAEKEGYPKDYLKRLAKVIDFEAFHLKFIESRVLVNDMLGADREKQKALVDMLIPEIESLEKDQLERARHYCRIDKRGGHIINRIDITAVNNRSQYPAVGKATGLLHDSIAKEFGCPVITLSYGPDFIIFRATDDAKNFNVHEILRSVKDKMPYSGADGGGHEVAGTIKFIEASREEVIKAVDDFLEENIPADSDAAESVETNTNDRADDSENK